MNIKKKNLLLVFIILAIIVALAISVFIFNLKSAPSQKAKSGQPQEAKAVKYWTCGMHPSVRISDEEYKKGTKNCPICGMDLIPVSEEPQTESAVETKTRAEAYYGCGVKEEGHCPHCDEGKQDAQCICGGHSFMIKTDKEMYCPVCKKPLKRIEPEDLLKSMAHEAGTETLSRIRLNAREIELAGLATEPVNKYQLTKKIRTVGRVAFDPGLSVAQEEFLTALETRQKVSASSDPDVIKRADNLVEKSRFKLRLLGMSNDEIADLEKRGTAQLNLVLPEDKAWIYADVYEYELAWVKIGQGVLITTSVYPGEEFKGTIKSVNPVINPMTRSATIRIEADNTDQKLKPEMYADVVINIVYVGVDNSTEVLAIPKEAVLDTGIRKIVYVDAGSGTFLGKEVKIGPLATAYVDGQDKQFYPVISGVQEGEKVVTKANFLIDSQSQISGTAAAAYGGALGAKEEAQPQAHQH